MDLALARFPLLQLHKWRGGIPSHSPPLRPPSSFSFSFSPLLHTRHVRYGKCAWRSNVRVRASDVGAASFEGGSSGAHGNGNGSNSSSPSSDQIGTSDPPTAGMRYPLSIAGVLAVSAGAFALIVALKGGPSVVIDALAKSGFTAAFALIFVSEIGDKTFFIAALLAMQYKRALVLLGSTAALSIMTILSVAIGRIFQSVPAQFQTSLPIGEYAAVALLTFFGLKSIKDAWELPSTSSKDSNDTADQLGELVEAEELVKEKVAKKLTSALEIVWKSFSLVFLAEWGDRSMLATIALGAAQSPIGVASGAIAGHLAATSIAILGGAFLANYISEKMVGLLGGVLFLIFAAATFFGVF